MDDTCIELLKRAKWYIALEGDKAEREHGDLRSNYYMDIGMYEIMEDSDDLLNKIDEYLNELDYEAPKINFGPWR